MEKKYELTKETITIDSHTLYRIKSLKDFNDVKKGELGGFIESEENLSHNGGCWVYNNSCIYENARIYGNAQVYDNATIFGNSEIYDNATVCDNVSIFDNAKVFNKVIIHNDAKIFNNAKVFNCVRVFNCVKIYGSAQVYDYATVSGNSEIYDNARVFNISKISNSIVCDNARVYGDSSIYKNSEIRKNAKILGNSSIFNSIISDIELSEHINLKNTVIKSYTDFIIFRKFWSNNEEYIVYTKSNNMFSCEEFYGTKEEFIENELKKSKENGVNCSLFLEFIKMIK